MLKNIITAVRLAANTSLFKSKLLVHNVVNSPESSRNISYLLPQVTSSNQSLLQNSSPTNYESVRTIIKYNWKKGKREADQDVLKRFYRLRWGGWIRRIAGSHKRMWKKSAARKIRVKQHVFCNATQCTLLDKMAGKFWTKPRYYVDDPYEPYHSREEFVYTAKKPRPYIPPEER